ncbi:MAG: class 1 fructose-bisphosphatase [Chloroflexota bacterium]
MPITHTLERHILTAQQDFPDATGTLTALLYDIALAAKVIAREATRTHIVELDSRAREPRARSLERFASNILLDLNSRTGRVGAIAMETVKQIVTSDGQAGGSYALVLDPLDGVSETDYTVSIGTIFGIYRPHDSKVGATKEDCLQPGRNLVAAGYILYGSSVEMVYSSGQGLNGFTLDPGLGEFLLSHENIRIPEPPRYYSLNHAHDDFWGPGMRRFARYLQGKDLSFPGGLSLRYTGSLVADFHRNLLAGGIFCYPADTVYPNGKMFLAYEANPLAFLAEQAGGDASNGSNPILEQQPDSLTQRTPFFIGNRKLVQTAVEFLQLYQDNSSSVT